MTVALLKGRANYVCHYHLERALQDGRLASRDDARYLREIERFARTSRTGDKADCTAVPENASVWSYVTSTRENCLGSQCPHYDACFVMEARRQALAADVVVVNHHLFFADLVLRDEGVSELLPACNTIDLRRGAPAAGDRGSVLRRKRVDHAVDRAGARHAARKRGVAPPTMPRCRRRRQALDKAARDLRLAFAEESGRFPMRALAGRADFESALQTVLERLDELAGELQKQAERSEGLARLRERALGARRARRALAERRRRGARALGGALRPRRCISTRRRSRSRRSSGARSRGHARSWIFTSATLSVNRDFSHYCGEMGLTEARTASWDSPFDFAAQALLYVPERLPEPNTREHTAAVVEAALPVIEAAGGGAFMLFTSLRAMREAHELLRAAFEKRGLELPAARAGRGLALGDAGPLPRPGQRRAGRQPLVLGGRGRARQRRSRWW